MLTRMLKAILLICGLLLGSMSQAEIYRWVDADGRTHFSDRRPLDTAAQVILSDLNPVEANLGDGSSEMMNSQAPWLGPYEVFDILVPAAGAVLNQPVDDITVSLLVDPPLIVGHRLSLVLNGNPADLDAQSTQWQFIGVGFGAHRLQAQIHDQLGAMIAVTQLHEIELRQSLPPGVLP
ncbi:MAG: DUF4124 domain-containing protein [Sphingobacteriia bacterium]|nr:DUF4124 domain-containing protein [Sphingobacteriia bacterium]NCC38689.1 DUF4124 domain-containing protein [Gammaproteobacteria bacterium]